MRVDTMHIYSSVGSTPSTMPQTETAKRLDQKRLTNDMLHGRHNCTFSTLEKVSEPDTIERFSGTTNASECRRTMVMSGGTLVSLSDLKKERTSGCGTKLTVSFKAKVPSGGGRLRASDVKKTKSRPKGVKKCCDRTLTSDSPPSTRSFPDLDIKLTIHQEGLTYNCQLRLEVPCSSPEPSSTTPTSLFADLQATTQERIPASCQNRLQVLCNSPSPTTISSISKRKTVILEKGCDNKPTVTSTSSEQPQPTPITFLSPADCPQDSIPSVREINTANLETASRNYLALQSSNWYYDGLTWQESSALLANTPPGTFLIRNSSDPKFLFSLSVQTDRGPTSVRLHFIDGRFRLDADKKLVPTMPTFPSVIELVEYYIAITNSGDKNKKTEQVWIDGSGTTYASILLTRPLYHKTSCPSLKHMARLAINRLDDPKVATVLPGTLRQYLAEYPYKL